MGKDVLFRNYFFYNQFKIIKETKYLYIYNSKQTGQKTEKLCLRQLFDIF